MSDGARDDEVIRRTPRSRPKGRTAPRSAEGGLVRYDPLRAYMAEVARHPVLSREE